jgi:orotate phosphoribosyltransferase
MPTHEIELHFPDWEDILPKVYSEALVLPSVRPYYREGGGQARWGLDLRMPLSKEWYLRAVCELLSEVLTGQGASQVVGFGYGSFILVGGVLLMNKGFRAGLLRPERKPYGFRKILEGSVTRQHAVTIIDDLLGSGRTTLAACRQLEGIGFKVSGVLTVFRLGWKGGKAELEAHGVRVNCLATLHDRRRSDSKPSP